MAENTDHMENHIGDMMANEVNTEKKALQIERPRSNSDIPATVNHTILSESASTKDSFKELDSVGKISSSSNANGLDGPARQPTRRSASDVSSNKRLDEYHKWKVAGCKGDPPAKLKISQ